MPETADALLSPVRSLVLKAGHSYNGRPVRLEAVAPKLVATLGAAGYPTARIGRVTRPEDGGDG